MSAIGFFSASLCSGAQKQVKKKKKNTLKISVSEREHKTWNL